MSKIKSYNFFITENTKSEVSLKEINDQLQWFSDSFEKNDNFGYISNYCKDITEEEYFDGQYEPIGEGLIREYRYDSVENSPFASDSVYRPIINTSSEILEELALRKRNLEDLGYEFWFCIEPKIIALIIFKPI